MMVEIHFDGGCRSNPNGPASSGAVIRTIDGRTLRHVGRAIGIASNNVAEWTGLLIGLEAARELGATDCRVYGDSKLVVEQFSGNYAVRDEKLREIALRVSNVVREFTGVVTLEHVRREHNKAADAICNAVLDGTYRDDAFLQVASTEERSKAKRIDVTVGFVVEVTMDSAEAAASLAAGATCAELRKKLAERVETRLLLSGAGGDPLRVTRVRG